MLKGLYRIAEHVVCICSLHHDIHDLCQNYRTEVEKWDIMIVTTQSDIDVEKEIARKEGCTKMPVKRSIDAALEHLKKEFM